MKPVNTISPETYNAILKVLDLVNIQLYRFNAKMNEEIKSNCLVYSIKDTIDFTQTDNLLRINYTYKFEAKNKDADKKDIAIVIEATYKVFYRLKDGGYQITEEFMDIFGKMSLSILLWPYFREFINNTIYRMGLPQLILPLKRT